MKAFDLPGAHPYGQPGDHYSVRTDFAFGIRDVIDILLMRGGMTNPNGPLWSLVIEFQIYVVVMAVAAWWQNGWLGRAWTAVLGLAAIYLLRDALFFVAVWMLGAATAFGPSLRRSSWFALAAAILILSGVALWRPDLIGPNMDTTLGHMTQLASCVGYAALLFYLYPRLRYPRMLIATGNFSYSLYIIHFPILMFMLSLTQDWIGHSEARTVLTTLAGAVTIIALVIPFALVLEQPAFFKRMLFRAASAIPAKLQHRIVILSIVGLLSAAGASVLVYRHVQKCHPVFDTNYIYLPAQAEPSAFSCLSNTRHGRNANGWPVTIPPRSQ